MEGHKQVSRNKIGLWGAIQDVIHDVQQKVKLYGAEVNFITKKSLNFIQTVKKANNLNLTSTKNVNKYVTYTSAAITIE